jgi:hypothetical protein
VWRLAPPAYRPATAVKSLWSDFRPFLLFFLEIEEIFPYFQIEPFSIFILSDEVRLDFNAMIPLEYVR